MSIVYWFGIGLALGGAMMFNRGFRWFRENQLIQNTPTSKVRSIAMGRVELYGTAVPFERKRVRTPFSGVDCVWCEWKVEELRHTGKDKIWVKVKDGVIPGFFHLRDETGQVLVYTRGAEVDDAYYKEYSNRSGGRIPRSVLSALDKMGVKTSDWFRGEKILCASEFYLAPWDKVYVLGDARDNPAVPDGTSERNEDDIIIAKKGFYFISRKPLDKVYEYHAAKVYSGLIGGSLLILAGLSIILFYSGFI